MKHHVLVYPAHPTHQHSHWALAALAALALVSFLPASPAAAATADRATYCLSSDSQSDCGFASLAQCEATAAGTRSARARRCPPRAAGGRRAATRSRPSPSSGWRTCRCRRGRRQAHLDVVRVDAERVGHDLRERRVVALPVRAGAAVGDHAAVVVALHARPLELAARALDVERDTGADDVPASPRLGSSSSSGEVHAALVVAGVVGPAERRRVRERPHEVAPAQLDRVEPELRAASSTVSSRNAAASGRPAPRHGPVGTLSVRVADDGHRAAGDVVAAAHQHRARVRRDRAVDEQVRAEVRADPRADREHPAVARRGRAPRRPSCRAPGRRRGSSRCGPRSTSPAGRAQRGGGDRATSARACPWTRTLRRRRAGSPARARGRCRARARARRRSVRVLGGAPHVSPSPSRLREHAARLDRRRPPCAGSCAARGSRVRRGRTRRRRHRRPSRTAAARRRAQPSSAS